MALELAIAFCGTMVAAWTGLCLYLRATHHTRIVDSAIAEAADISDDEISAQAA